MSRKLPTKSKKTTSQVTKLKVQTSELKQLVKTKNYLKRIGYPALAALLGENAQKKS